jgi:predicted metalloprotease with PDZ domain
VVSLQQVGLQLRTNGGDRLIVDGVRAGSPAEIVGFQTGDRLVGINRRRVRNLRTLSDRLRTAQPLRVTFQVQREGVVTEVFLSLHQRELERLRTRQTSRRRCVTLCRRWYSQQWYECGCAVVRAKVCNACAVGG